MLWRLDLMSSWSVLLFPCSWERVSVSKCVYMRFRTFHVQGHEQLIPKTTKVNLWQSFKQSSSGKRDLLRICMSLHICCVNFARHFNRCLLKHSPRESKQCHLGEADTTKPSAAQLQLSVASVLCQSTHCFPSTAFCSAIWRLRHSLLHFWCKLLQRTTFLRKIW